MLLMGFNLVSFAQAPIATPGGSTTPGLDAPVTLGAPGSLSIERRCVQGREARLAKDHRPGDAASSVRLEDNDCDQRTLINEGATVVALNWQRAQRTHSQFEREINDGRMTDSRFAEYKRSGVCLNSDTTSTECLNRLHRQSVEAQLHMREQQLNRANARAELNSPDSMTHTGALQNDPNRPATQQRAPGTQNPENTLRDFYLAYKRRPPQNPQNANRRRDPLELLVRPTSVDFTNTNPTEDTQQQYRHTQQALDQGVTRVVKQNVDTSLESSGTLEVNEVDSNGRPLQNENFQRLLTGRDGRERRQRIESAIRGDRRDIERAHTQAMRQQQQQRRNPQANPANPNNGNISAEIMEDTLTALGDSARRTAAPEDRNKQDDIILGNRYITTSIVGDDVAARGPRPPANTGRGPARTPPGNGRPGTRSVSTPSGPGLDKTIIHEFESL